MVIVLPGGMGFDSKATICEQNISGKAPALQRESVRDNLVGHAEVLRSPLGSGSLVDVQGGDQRFIHSPKRLQVVVFAGKSESEIGSDGRLRRPLKAPLVDVNPNCASPP